MSGEKFSLPATDKLLVPFSDRESNRLEGFQEGVDGLPIERRATVLDALLDPLLDVRVARIERQIEALISGQQVSEAKIPSQPIADRYRFPWLQHGLVALVTAVLIIAVLIASQRVTEGSAALARRFDSVVSEIKASESRMSTRLDRLQTKVEATLKKTQGSRGEAKSGKAADDKTKQ